MARTTPAIKRALAALIVGALLVSGCAEEGGEAKGIQLLKSDTLLVCVHLPAKPFEYQEGDQVVGFNVDLIELFAKDLDVEPEYVNVNEWNQVTSGAVFRAGKCDVGMGGMTITPERQKALTISDPYFDATQGLLVRKNTPYRTLADLKDKKVGVMTASTGAEYADERKQRMGFTPVKFTDLALELNSFKAGKVDAVVHDNGPLYDYVNDNPNSHVVTEFDTGEQYGFSARKNDSNAKKLINRLNDVLAQAKHDGSYDKSYRKWFRKDPPEQTK